MLENIIFLNFALVALGISRLTLKIWNRTSEKCSFLGLINTIFSKFCPRYSRDYTFNPSLKFLGALMQQPTLPRPRIAVFDRFFPMFQVCGRITPFQIELGSWYLTYIGGRGPTCDFWRFQIFCSIEPSHSRAKIMYLVYFCNFSCLSRQLLLFNFS